MFVRWKVYHGLWDSHRAYLVQAVRVDGRPRQRVVCYLASCQESRLLFERRQFWQAARQKLAGADLDDATWARCEAALAAVVPEPTAAEEAAEQARVAAPLLRGLGGR
jgi:hypothetical protein